MRDAVSPPSARPQVNQTLFPADRMEPAAPEKLLEAFKLFDAEGKGTISKDQMTKLMMEEGEPFSQVETSNRIPPPRLSSRKLKSCFLGGNR